MTGQTNHTLQRNPGLDLMRSLSLIMVMSAHALHLFVEVLPQVAHLSHLVRNGVEAFFSLSGFLIGNVMIASFSGEGHKRQALFAFYRRRWFRTLPLYYTGIFLNLLAGVFITGNKHFDWTFLACLQNLQEAAFHFFPVSYSLAIEEWFYLLFPLLLLLLVQFFNKNLVSMLVLLCVLYIAGGLLVRYSLYSDPLPHWDAGIRKTLTGRIDACIYGILIAVLFNTHRPVFEKYRWHMLIAAVILYLTAMWGYLFRYDSAFNYVWYFTFIPLAFALCIPCVYALPVSNAHLVKIITSISLLSFALYIVHLNPVMEIIVVYFTLDNWTSVLQAFFLFVSVSLALAYLLNRFIEKPFMKFGAGRSFISNSSSENGRS